MARVKIASVPVQNHKVYEIKKIHSLEIVTSFILDVDPIQRNSGLMLPLEAQSGITRQDGPVVAG